MARGRRRRGGGRGSVRSMLPTDSRERPHQSPPILKIDRPRSSLVPLCFSQDRRHNRMHGGILRIMQKSMPPLNEPDPKVLSLKPGVGENITNTKEMNLIANY